MTNIVLRDLARIFLNSKYQFSSNRILRDLPLDDGATNTGQRFIFREGTLQSPNMELPKLSSDVCCVGRVPGNM